MSRAIQYTNMSVTISKANLWGIYECQIILIHIYIMLFASMFR